MAQNVDDSVPPRGTNAVIGTARGWHALAGILLVALLIRSFHALGAWLATRGVEVFYLDDSASYVSVAREFLSAGAFGRGGEPEIFRTPGYPLLLIPGLLLGRVEITTIALQIALAVATTFGVAVLSLRVFADGRIALAAAALYAFEPLSISFSAILMSETLFTAVVVWGLVSVIDWVRRGVRWRLVAGVALLAVAAYVRPAGYYLPFALVLLLGLRSVVRREWRRLGTLALAALAAVAVVLPWQLRNRTLGYSGFSAVAAVNMYFYNAAAVRAVRADTGFLDMQAGMGYWDQESYLRLHPEQRAWRPGERFEFMGRDGMRTVRENLPLFARQCLMGAARVALNPGVGVLLGSYGLVDTGQAAYFPGIRGIWDRIRMRTNALARVVSVAFGLALLALYGLTACCLLTRRWRSDPAVWLLVASAAYFVLIAGGPVGSSRFRHPAMPLFCVLAAGGLYSAARAIWIRRRGDRPGGAVVVGSAPDAAISPIA